MAKNKERLAQTVSFSSVTLSRGINFSPIDDAQTLHS